MITQLVEDLLHLEGRGERFDEYGRFCRAPIDSQSILGVVEDVVPQARLEVAFDLWQIEVGTAPSIEQTTRVVEEEEPEVKKSTRHLLPVNDQVLLLEVPPARTENQSGQVVSQPVFLALGTCELNRLVDRVYQIDVTLGHVLPCRRVGVLEIGHEGTRS